MSEPANADEAGILLVNEDCDARTEGVEHHSFSFSCRPGAPDPHNGNGLTDSITVDLKECAPAPSASREEAPALGVLANGEKEVLVELAEGLTNKEIASRLRLSVRAVEAHRERLMRKLRIRGVARLTQFAVSQGLVALDGVAESSRRMQSNGSTAF